MFIVFFLLQHTSAPPSFWSLWSGDAECVFVLLKNMRRVFKYFWGSYLTLRNETFLSSAFPMSRVPSFSYAPSSLLSLPVMIPYGLWASSLLGCWVEEGGMGGLGPVSILYRFVFLLLFSPRLFHPLPCKLGQCEGVIMLTQGLWFFSRWFCFLCHYLAHIFTCFVQPSWFSSCSYLALIFLWLK